MVPCCGMYDTILVEFDVQRTIQMTDVPALYMALCGCVVVPSSTRIVRAGEEAGGNNLKDAVFKLLV